MTRTCRTALLLGLAITLAQTSVFAQSSTSDGWPNYSANRPWDAGSEPLSLSDANETKADDDMPVDTDSTSSYSNDDPDPILWNGFFYGDRHFRSKPRPVGSPLYFEDPFINSDIRPFFIYHEFPRATALRGGRLMVYGFQARIALTERLQFFATEDGYSDLESPIIPSDEGWNDLAAGLKYAFYVDHEEDFIASAGVRWRLSNGDAGLLQGGTDEVSTFVTMYKGYGKWNFLADAVYRIPTDYRAGNAVFSWDAQVAYELFDDFFPLLEFHGLHYLTDGDRFPLNVGGLDYANIGASNVAGHDVFWGGVGFRWNISDGIQFGSVYEFPLQSVEANDIFEQRVTTSIVFTF